MAARKMAAPEQEATARSWYFDLKGKPISRAESHRMMKARQAKIEAEYGVQFVGKRLAEIPPGKGLMHTNGFGAFLFDLDDVRWADRELCDCGWAPDFVPHYRKVRDTLTPPT